MEIIVKHFSELSVDELWNIFYLRDQVFIVEQKCPYQDIDEHDKCAYHVMCYDDNRMVACARVLPKNTMLDEISIGRVVCIKRRCGLATKMLKKAIEVAIDKFNAQTIKLMAQTYAIGLYQKVGFKEYGEVFLEDDIPHIMMTFTIK